MSEDDGNARVPFQLVPPSFALPQDMEDYELWTVRLPHDIDVEQLQNMELDMSNPSSLASFQANDVDYGLREGGASENAQFRLLLRHDDDTFLRPNERPFDRHVNVTATIGETLDTDLAPRFDGIRRSYSHVPQASGLKRRFMPPGAGCVPSTIQGDDKSKPSAKDVKASSCPKRQKTDKTPPTASVASSIENDGGPITSSRTKEKEEVYMNGDHSSSKQKAKKSKRKKKDKKKKG